MKNSPKKKLDRFVVESAAIDAKGKLEFLDFGLHQEAFEWNEDAIAGAAAIVHDIQGELEILTKYFHQTWKKIYHSDQATNSNTEFERAITQLMDPARAFVPIIAQNDSEEGAVLDSLFMSMHNGILEEINKYNHILKEV